MDNNAPSLQKSSEPNEHVHNKLKRERLSPRLYLLLWQKDPSLRYQWWLTAFSCFTICLILLSITAFSATLNDARNMIKAEITIQVPTLERGYRADGQEPLLDAIDDLLNKTPGIASVRLLSIEEIRDILRPWVGDEVELQGLPVPYVIAVGRSKKKKELDLTTLKGQLNALEANIVIDDHSNTLSDISKLESTAFYTSIIALVAAILMLSVISIIAVNVALHLQRNVLNILFMAGASDRFLANQFTFIGLSMAARGLIVGTGAATLVYLVGLQLLELDYIAGPLAGLRLGQLFALVLLSAVVLLVSGLSTRLTVMRRLRQIY